VTAILVRPAGRTHLEVEVLYGRIIYTASGHMSAMVWGERKRFASSGRRHGITDEELRAAFESYDAYAGTYAVNQN
jgi:hypothetical protein